MAFYLAIEGGGTRTVGGFYDDTTLLAEATAGPSNPLAYGTAAAAGVISELATRLVTPGVEAYTLLAGIAGMMSEELARDMVGQLTTLPGLRHASITTDLHPLLYAHVPDRPGILAIAGTGSSILVHDGQGGFRRFGGRGQVMGDDGSGYKLGCAALQAIAHGEDGIAPPTSLQHGVPEALGLADAAALVPWSLAATKQSVAALASVVSEAAEGGDRVALECVQTQARLHARLTAAAAGTIAGDGTIPLFVQGGVIEHSELFRRYYFDYLSGTPRLTHEALRVRGHEAVLSLRGVNGAAPWCHEIGVDSPTLSSTEGQSENVAPIDQVDTATFVTSMVDHQRHVVRSLQQQHGALTKVVDKAGAALRAGGRILYMGAGTSGRLGVLDASECPPTFGTDPSQVVGIIAGGERALRDAVEGAEDDEVQGVADLQAQSPETQDILIGIAASGTTPYVLAALDHGRKLGCTTVLLCCNPQMAGHPVDHVIALATGPEVLPGSTRLNAGTATKVALNIITTGAMAQSGYVYAGCMVKMRASNIKLRARAVRMVAALADVSEARSAKLLEDAKYDIPIALIMAWHAVDASVARQRYQKSEGRLDEMIKESATP